uniref:Uncharacterized protein n=1 Tax=Kalanchoe fedtschenkoi TaxID=63787 RepID=A0A7N0T7C2_KALFE
MLTKRAGRVSANMEEFGRSRVAAVSSSSKASKGVVQGPNMPKKNALAVGKQSAYIVNAKASQQSGSNQCRKKKRKA